MLAFINVYASGFYHRLNKPGQFNCHPGDIYPTREAAENDVDPEAAHLYLGTFPTDIPAEILGKCNGADSVPTPLSESRRLIRKGGPAADIVGYVMGGLREKYATPSHIEGMRPITTQVQDWPLETSEHEAEHLTTEEVIGRWGTGEQGR